MFCGPKIICIAVLGSGPSASYIGNNNLSRKSHSKSANNIVRTAEHASRMRINLSSRSAIFARDKRNNLQQQQQREAICDSCTRDDSSLFLFLSLCVSLFLSLKWFTRGNKRGSANPGKKAPCSSAYVTFQLRCTGTLPLCFMRFRHARNCEQTSRGDDLTPLFPEHYCRDKDCSNSRTTL